MRDVRKQAAQRIASALDAVVEIRGVTGKRQQVHKGGLGHRIRRISWHIADLDASGFGCLEVNIVDTCRRLADKTEARRHRHQLIIYYYLIDYQYITISHPFSRLSASAGRI